MLKIVSVAIMMHTEKAIGEVLSDVACPVFQGRNMRIEGTRTVVGPAENYF